MITEDLTEKAVGQRDVRYLGSKDVSKITASQIDAR